MHSAHAKTGIRRVGLTGLPGFWWRRGRANRYLLLAAALGVLVACVILAGVPMYLRTLELMGLHETLDRIGPVGKNINVINSEIPSTARSFRASTQAVMEVVDSLGDLVTGTADLIRSRPLLWAAEEAQLRSGPGASAGRLQRLAHLQDHVDFVDGRAPFGETGLEGGIRTVEAAVPAARATALDVRVGDMVQISRDPPGFGSAMVRITGMFEPLDADSEFWMGSGPTLLAPEPEGLTAPPPLPFFLEGDAIFHALSAVQSPLTEGRWFVYVDSDAARRARPGDLAGRIEDFDLETRTALPGTLILTSLGQPLRGLERQLAFARMPTLLMGALLLTIAGYYLFTVAVTLTERGQPDDGALRGRGMTVRQLAVLRASEAVAVTALPFAAAPFVAAAGIRLFAWLPAYGSLVSEMPLPVELTAGTFVWSAAGAAASLALLVGSAFLNADRLIVTERLALTRADRPPLFQRYFLDLAVLALGGLVVWDLVVRRGVVGSESPADPSSSPLLLIGPAFFLVSVALIALRLFGPTARLLAWFAARQGPSWTCLSAMRVARRPYWYARSFVLLLVATSTVVFAASLSSTLRAGVSEEAAYEVGSDLRAVLAHVPRGIHDETLDLVRNVTGVSGASLTFRTRGELGSTGAGGGFQLLAVETEEFSRVAWYRDDFSELPPAALLSSIAVSMDVPRLIFPDSATRVGLWVRADPPRRNQTLRVHLRDSEGRLVSQSLGPLDGSEWQYRSAAIPANQRPPVELTAITVFETVRGDAGTPGSIYLDDLDVTYTDSSAGLQKEVIESFEAEGLWRTFPTSQGFDSSLERTSEEQGRGRASVTRLTLGRGTDDGFRGIYRPSVEAFPVVASVTFLEENSLAVGDSFVVRAFDRLVPLKISATASLFPTLDPAGGGFLVADARALWNYLTLRGWTMAATKAEVFVGLDESRYDEASAAVHDVLGPTAHVLDRRELESGSLVTPLAVAGWSGASAVAVYLGVIVATLGFAIHLAAAGPRMAFESGVLRSIGISRLGLLTITAAEHLGVVALGAAAGAAAGYAMTRLVVATVAFAGPGRESAVPVSIVTDWTPMWFMCGAFFAAALMAVAVMMLAFERLPLSSLARPDTHGIGQ